MALIEYSVAGPAAIIRIARPEKLNALNREVLTGIIDGLARADADPAVSAAVLTGTGKAFSVGADIAELSASLADPEARIRESLRLLSSPERARKPVIAAINGMAFGGGFEITIACDIVVAAETATFGVPEPKLGIVPQYALSRLPGLVGVAAARDILLSGRILTAAEAKEVGILTRVVPGEALMAAAGDIAADIAKLAPAAVAYMKDTLNAPWPRQSPWANAYLLGTADAVEGRAAFAEKRAPQFGTGRNGT